MGQGVGGVREDWKIRGGELIPSKGPEWIGIHHYEQDIGLPSKLGFSFHLSMQWIMSRTINYMFCKYKDRIFV
jgi:hypothetical protein